MAAPTFYYDFNSPYSYLAAHRIDDLMPVECEWQPIAFGVLIGEIGKVPWSLKPETREPGLRECEARARARGLPPIRWPEGWPDRNYSLRVLRAALIAQDRGRLREFSLAAYEQNFVRAADLREPEPVLDAARAAGLDPAEVGSGVEAPEIKQRLKDVTAAAIARGVTGVPTVAVGDELFWGDDRLEAAAAVAGA